ncbi:proteasome activator complex subunit 4 [Pelomyxa schiedti]|nr:proteasome activator complex subunit 4 [Pelomyxa schiedti]
MASTDNVNITPTTTEVTAAVKTLAPTAAPPQAEMEMGGVGKFLPPSYAAVRAGEGEEGLRTIMNGLQYSLTIGDILRGVPFFLRELSKWLGHKYHKCPSRPSIDPDEASRLKSKEEALTFVVREIYSLICNAGKCDTVPSGIAYECAAPLCRVLQHLKELKNKKGGVAEEKNSLQLDWRPLYDLLVRELDYPTFRIGSSNKLSKIQPGTLYQLVLRCRPFFPPSSPSEILTTFTSCHSLIEPVLPPGDCPVCLRAGVLLALFTPSTQTGDLLPDYIRIWSLVQNNKHWNEAFINLIGRIAKHKPACIGLPHAQKILLFSSQHQKHAKSAAKLVASAAISGNVGESYACRFLASLSSYYQPSNTGFWVAQLQTFSNSLCRYLVQCESNSVDDSNTTCTSCAIGEGSPLIMSLVSNALLPSIFVHSTPVSVQACASLMHLAYIAPHTVFELVLPRIYSALSPEDVSENTAEHPHYRRCAIDAVAAFIHPLLTLEDAGSKHLYRILQNTLPNCINPNDLDTTIAALKLYYRICTIVPILADNSRESFGTDFKHMSQFPSIVLDKVLDTVKSLESPEGKDTKWTHKLFASLLKALFSILFSLVPPHVYVQLMRRVGRFVENTIAIDAIEYVEIIVSCCTLANPSVALPYFIKICHSNLLCDGHLAEHTEEAPEVEWFLGVLGATCSSSAGYVLQSWKQIMEILKSAYSSENLVISKATALAMNKILQGVCSTYPLEYRPTQEVSWAEGTVPPFANTQLWRELAFLPCRILRNGVVWHEPSLEEMNLVGEIITQFFNSAAANIISVINNKKRGSQISASLVSSLRIIKSILDGASSILLPIAASPTLGRISNFQGLASLTHPYIFCGAQTITRNLRKESAEILCSLFLHIGSVGVGEGEVTVLETAALVAQAALGSAIFQEHRAVRTQQFMILKKWKTPGGKHRCRTFAIMKAYSHHLQRVKQACQTAGSHDALVADLITHLVKLLCSPFSTIRTPAFWALVIGAKQHPELVDDSMLPEVLNVVNSSTTFSSMEEHEGALRGAAMLLLSPPLRRRIMSRWEMFFLVIRALCTAVGILEGQKLQITLFTFFGALLNSFQPPMVQPQPTPNRTWVGPSLPSTCSALRHLDEDTQRGYSTLLQRHEEDQVALGKILTTITSSPKSHWRHDLLCVSFLTAVALEMRRFGLPFASPEVPEYLWLALTSPFPPVRSIAITSAHAYSKHISPLHTSCSDITSLLKQMASDRAQQIRESNANEGRKRPGMGTMFGDLQALFSLLSTEPIEHQLASLLSPRLVLRLQSQFRPAIASPLFNFVIADFFKRSVQRNGELQQICLNCVNTLLIEVNTSAGSEEAEGLACICAEVTAGCLRAGMKSTEGGPHIRAWTKIVIECLTNAPMTTVEHWCTALRYGIHHTNSNQQQIVAGVVETMLAHSVASRSTSKSLQVANSTKCATAFLAEVHTGIVYNQFANSGVVSLLSSEYDVIRRDAGKFIASLLSKCQQIPDLYNSILASLMTEFQSITSGRQEDQDTIGRGFLGFVTHTIQSGWIISLAPSMQFVLGTVFSLATAENPETSKEARQLLATIAEAILPHKAFPFAQVLGYVRFDFVISMLSHNTIEVRNMASQSLGSLLQCPIVNTPYDMSAPTGLDALASRFLKEATTGTSPEARHGGVLGLCALLATCPYSVPPYAPRLVSLLADIASSSEPTFTITSAKAALQQFWHTHQGSTWHLYKHLFDEAQMQALLEGRATNIHYFA